MAKSAQKGKSRNNIPEKKAVNVNTSVLANKLSPLKLKKGIINVAEIRFR
ncbi:hypothetical protein ACFL0T_00885 [Candidatus Omnitrophota bacterium]